eukprot:Ihof_evm1s316 gene=Ihof_evmTU1s316
MTSFFVRRAIPFGCTYARFYSTATALSFKDAVEFQPVPQVTRLSNGIRVATESTNNESTSVGLYVSAGTRHETHSNSGASNMISHMIFKGKKNKSSKSPLEIVNEMGATLEAIGGREITEFRVNTTANQIEKAIDLLGDIFVNPVITSKDLDRERESILKTMKVSESNLRWLMMAYLHQTAYQGHGLGNSLHGTTANITNLTASQLKDFMKRYYTTDGLVVAVSGRVKHEDVVKAVTKAFSSLGFSSRETKDIPPRLIGSEVRFRDDDIPYAHIALALACPKADHPHTVPLMVATSMLGSWHKSQIPANVRSFYLPKIMCSDKNTEYIDHFHIPYKDGGLLGGYFISDRMTIDNSLSELQYTWIELCIHPREIDIAKARQKLRAQIATNGNNSREACINLGRHILYYGRAITPAEWVARVDAVDADTLGEVMSEYHYDK